MVHHICLLQAHSKVTPEKIEEIIIETRIRLLKIPEINNLHVGKRIDTENNPYTYFYSHDIENLDKLKYAQESAVFTQFQKQIIEPHIEKLLAFDYEMDPGKDIKYS